MEQILRALQIHSLELQLGDVGFIVECAERLGGDAAVLHKHAEALRKQLRSVCEGLEYQGPKEEPVTYGTPVELNPGETITVIDFLREKGRQWSTNAAAVGCMAVAEWRRQNPGKEICKVHDGMFVHNAYEADSLPILERVLGKLLKREAKEQASKPPRPVYYETEEWVTAFLKLFPDMFRVSKGIVHPIGASPPEHEELDLGPGLWTPIGLPRHSLRVPSGWPPPMQALRTSRIEPWAPLRTMPTEPHELHRDVANAGSLIRPDPLTEPLDSQSEPSPSSPPSALNHAASSVSGVSVSWQPSEDPWMDLARRDAESRGIELLPFQMQRLATTLRERFGYDLAEATHELEV